MQIDITSNQFKKFVNNVERISASKEPIDFPDYSLNKLAALGSPSLRRSFWRVASFLRTVTDTDSNIESINMFCKENGIGFTLEPKRVCVFSHGRFKV